MSGWWESLYDELVGELLLSHRDPALAERAVDFVVDTAGLRAGDAVFDQGSGTGRLALPFLRRGFVVYGVDAIPAYVDEARVACASFGERARFACDDMARHVPPGPVDVVVSWWTCLGYWANDDDNRAPLCRAFEALRPGGTFVVDTMNVAQVLRGFRAVETDTLARPDGTAALVRTSRIELSTGTLHKTWAWTLPSGTTRTHESAVRLYLPHEWRRLLREAGFADVDFFGDVDGSALQPDSPRCLIVARRPA
jgi:SAM-dependent methyltransferase